MDLWKWGDIHKHHLKHIIYQQAGPLKYVFARSYKAGGNGRTISVS